MTTNKPDGGPAFPCLTRRQYLMTKDGSGVRHTWAVVTPHGGMHFWVVDKGEGTPSRFPERYYGGVEIHYLVGNGEPDNEKCWLLEAPCWHDGSSLYASEVWIPFWLDEPSNYGRIFERLEREALERLTPDDDLEARDK